MLSAGPAQAPPIVLVHGVAANRCAWLPLIAELQSRHRLIALDLYGHGANRSRFSLQAAVVAIADLCHMQTAPPTLVGWSLGGLLALRVIADEPTIASSLILTGATIQPGRLLGPLLVAASLGYRLGDTVPATWFARRLVQRRYGPAAKQMIECGVAPGDGLLALRDVAREDWLGLANRVTVPVLIANGSRDRIALPAEPRFAAAMPQASVTRIRGAGHLVPIERPGELAAALDGFLRSVR
jgi:pimeloyl-ACP methyl ester carboxylesterase